MMRKLGCMIALQRLQALRELADRGTVAAAADALHLTPSAVSQQLAALERETGARLVEREGRTLRLTSAGDVLLRHADELFAQVERLRADLAAHEQRAAGEVRVGGFATSLAGLLVPAAARLRETAPGVELRLTDMEAPEGLRRLAARQIDLLVTMESAAAPAADDARFHREDLLADVLDAALPADHPLASRERVALADLAREPWVLPPDGWTCDEVVQGACRAAGFSPRPAHRSGDWTAVLGMVGAGLGVALVPRLARSAPPAGAVLRPLRGEPAARHVLAACRRGAEGAPALRAVLDALREVAAAA